MKYVLFNSYVEETFIFTDKEEIEELIRDKDNPQEYLEECEFYEIGNKVEFTLEMSLTLVKNKVTK